MANGRETRESLVNEAEQVMIYLTRTIFVVICLTVLSTAPFVAAQTKSKGSTPINAQPLKNLEGKRSERFPNELPNYRFYETAKWRPLEPLVSTMADVRRILGEPTEANDVTQYTKPYPGDDKAKQPVFTYNLNSDWQLLVYFVKYCFQGYVPLPSSLDNRLCSINLIPRKPLPFNNVVYPSVFTKKDVRAIHGAWTEYSDETGLFYEVYTSPGPYGDERPGDLNRIIYTASEAGFKKHSTASK